MFGGSTAYKVSIRCQLESECCAPPERGVTSVVGRAWVGRAGLGFNCTASCLLLLDWLLGTGWLAGRLGGR